MQCIYFRSYDRSSRSLDQESPSKKKKFQTNYASTTHLLAGKKVPSSLQTKSSDVETTVFYIPGVDVKVKGVYNSAGKHLLFPSAQIWFQSKYIVTVCTSSYIHSTSAKSFFSLVDTAKMGIMISVILHWKLIDAFTLIFLGGKNLKILYVTSKIELCQMTLHNSVCDITQWEEIGSINILVFKIRHLFWIFSSPTGNLYRIPFLNKGRSVHCR